MNRLERLYAISDELRRNAPRPVSAARLAERFDVSRRTIERDIGALRLGGAPLFTVDGPHGGAAMITTPDRTVLSLTAAEVTALVLAATSAGASPYSSAALGAVERLVEVLPDATRVLVDDLRRRIRVVPSAIDSGTPRVRAVLEEAVRTRTVVAITFEDRSGNVTRRRVEPVGFFADGQRWSLVGWCRLRDGARLFRLDRVSRPRLTAARAAPRDFDEVLGWVPEPGRTIART